MDIQKIAGGIGCDLVTGTGAFTARIGAIFAIVSNVDGTRIASVKELRSSSSIVAVSSRSYIGAVDINKNVVVIPDYPLTEITLSAGSAWVYYVNK
jgi:hypothetical protein